MPELYSPGKKAQERLELIPEGFVFEFNDEGLPVLLLKFDAAKLTSIVSGCQLELLVNNPRLTPKTFSLIIHDHPKSPLWIDGFEESERHKVHTDFSPAVIQLVGKSRIRLALYNELLMPVYSAIVPMAFRLSKWEEWIISYYTELSMTLRPDSGDLNTQELYKAFSIPIENVDHSDQPKLNIYFTLNEGVNAEQLTIEDYDFNNYRHEGKHGYHQELSVKNILGTYFEIGKEFFIAPLNRDGTEFIDFVLLLDNSYILFESKYVISNKATKVNNALSKAVEQLKKADEAIQNVNLQLADTKLADALQGRQYNLKVCLHNDSIYLTPPKCQAIIEKFEKMDLPMFISVSVLSGFLAALHIKRPAFFQVNLKNNLIQRFLAFYQTDEKVLIFREFYFPDEI